MTAATATPPASESTVIGEYGDLWRVYSSGSIQRADAKVAHFHRDTATLAWEDMELARTYRVAVGRLLANASLKVENTMVRGREGIAIDPNTPPRPAKHPDYGEYTPSLVRWRWRYAKDEFELIYGAISMDMEKSGTELPIKRKDIYPDYRSRWGEDQPNDREVTWTKAGGTVEKLIFERHKKGDPIPPHLWRCYGEEVVGHERKLPALCDTVLTFQATGADTDPAMNRDVNPNLRFD